MFSLVCALPSPAAAEACASLFDWFTGTTAQSDFSGTCMSALWFMAFADRSCSFEQDVREISRFSCMLFLSVRGFSDYAGPNSHSRNSVATVLPSSISEGSRHPDPSAFRSSIARPTGTSGLRFTRHLTVPPARLEARMESLFSFPVGLFHPLQHAGLSRRTPVCRPPCKSFVNGEKDSPDARLGGARTIEAIRTRSSHVCLSAVVPAFAEPDIHSLSQVHADRHRRLSVCSLPVLKQFVESLGSLISVAQSATAGPGSLRAV